MAKMVITNISKLLTLDGAVKKQGRHIQPVDLSIIEDAALVIEKEKIAWVGPQGALPKKYKKIKKLNARGQIVMPGFVDSHTHLVFAGDRSKDFEMKLQGKSYQEIAAQGGGILKTVKSTREASEKELLKLATQRIKNFIGQGGTTLEIKTGYGLDFKSEEKCLKVIQKLKKNQPIEIFSTMLSAHDIPPEFKGRKNDYIEVVANEWLPKFKKLADAVDIFIDEGYFDVQDGETLLSQAQKLNLPIKLHADELKLTGGADLAVKYKALSADHLLCIGPEEIQNLAQSEVTATLLPTTAYYLKVAYGPARSLLDAGARVALASDYNPGTSPTHDLALLGNLAALYLGMRIDEIIVAMTLNGAYALGLQNRKGALLPGYDADIIMFEAHSPAQLFYEFGQRQSSISQILTFGRILKNS